MELDKTDRKILEMVSKNPSICQADIAGSLEITQPAVCLRIKKLDKKGIIKTIRGLDVQAAGLFLVSAVGDGDLAEIRKNPYFLSGFEAGGKVHAVFAAENEDTAFSVAEALMEGVLVSPIDNIPEITMPFKTRGKCVRKCPDCPSYGKCLGLPGTRWYKGKLWG